jgi:hypothetical protein
MRKTAAKATYSSHHWAAARAMSLLAALLFLTSCAGVSAGGNQQQTTTLSLATAGLSFGNVAAGSSKTLTVTATNSGPASVTISAAAISTSYFSLIAPNLPATIAAGQSTPVTIKFTPNAAGSFAATLSIASNASNAQANVALSGAGIANGQLVLNPTSESFGSVALGAQQSQTVTLTNTGTSSVNISQASVSGAGFQLSGISTPLTLSASQSTTFTTTFAPQATGSASGTVTITSDAPTPTLMMALSGTGISPGALGSNPTSLSFGSVQVGSNKSLSEQVTNTGSTAITISQIAITGSGFSLSGITAPVTLTGGQSATFSVKFAPASAASANGTVTITSTAPNPTLTIPLSGTGTPATTAQLSVNPTTLAVGSIVVGTSGAASGSLIASGASVTVTAVNSNNSGFSVSGLSLPKTIPAGQSAQFTVTFSPQITGAVSATLTFTSNAQSSTTVETVTGTGTPAPIHAVNLSWNPSTSSGVSGYNIYRAQYVSSCSSYSKINSVLNTTTLYTDSSVVDGASYCYATTAVNASSEESSYSNIVSNVQIPAP